jgi:Ca-activated chloride channel homolog
MNTTTTKTTVMKHRKLIALFPATALWLSAVTGCDSRSGAEQEAPVASAERTTSQADAKADAKAADGSTRAAEPTSVAPMPQPMQAPAEEYADTAASPMRTGADKKSAKPSAGAPAGAIAMGGMGRKGKIGRVLDGGEGELAFAPRQAETHSEAYDHVAENAFISVGDDPRSTFSVDVDTASYANVRRFIEDGSLPPADAVRIEEMINYFDYDYRSPAGGDPFSLTAEVGECPWNESHKLVHVGLQGKAVDNHDVPAQNLVFLFDVSGSMNSPDKLPLLKRAFSLLVDNLRPQDKVSIVVYAGASGVVLEPTSAAHKGDILAALDRLSAGGSTNGGAGIHSAYAMAQKGFIQGGINRVILATDGDFNVGTTTEGDLVKLIEDKRSSGVFLSVLGFGTGNLKDATMEMLADKGNGNYAYIDSLSEARKVLVEEAGGTLVTIAKDVKLQIEWNPAEVASYRLIGYENRVLAHADFNDDTKDAGEIGAGHNVTAIYEVVPAGAEAPTKKVDDLKYQAGGALSAAAGSGELMTVKVRYKEPEGSTSKLLSFPVTDSDTKLSESSRDFRFSAAVAGFGMLLKGSQHKGDASFDMVRRLADEARGDDRHGHRAALVKLIDAAARLQDGHGPGRKGWGLE